MKTGVVIQARLGSKRFPRKVLQDLGGKTVIERVIERAWAIRGVDEVVVATYKDWELHQHVENLGYKSIITNSPMYGENDVLSRYKEVVDFCEGTVFGFDTIVRITGDCPLLDPEISSRVVENFHNGQYDYYSNCRPTSTFPDGMDTEVFSYDALAKAYKYAVQDDREHVTPYMWNNPDQFRCGRLVHYTDLSRMRMTLDTPEDLAYIRNVYFDLGDRIFHLEDVLNLGYTLTTNGPIC